MSSLVGTILAHPENAAFLRRFALTNAQALEPFVAWDDTLGIDPGAQTFFEDYGGDVPSSAKYSAGIYNLMVYPKTGLVFAAQMGRFTFMFRRDWASSGATSTDAWRQADTLDGVIDIRELGDPWALVCQLDEDERGLEMSRAYRLAEKARPAHRP